MGPMAAAREFVDLVRKFFATHQYAQATHIRCILKGSLAFTGKDHATDRAVALGVHGYAPEGVANEDVDAVVKRIWDEHYIVVYDSHTVMFLPRRHTIFDCGEALPEHPNGMIFDFRNTGPPIAEKLPSIEITLLSNATIISYLQLPCRTGLKPLQ